MPARKSSSQAPWKGRKQAARNNKGILQSKPKYQRTTSSPSPSSSSINNMEKRDDQPQQDKNDYNDPIPPQYIASIIQGFGPDADLYQDVLQVSPNATPRELRICYFRRGREILSEAGIRGLEGFSSGDDIPDQAKTRFQAVSMAYEILSKPEWKAIYYNEALPSSSETSSEIPSSPAEVIADVTENSRHSVRWNEEVEELLYEREPEEKKEDPAANKKKKKNRKTRIVIEQEDDELDYQLAKLDAEAETHFVDDFLDTLEESLDGLLKFAGGREKSTRTELELSHTVEPSPSSAPASPLAERSTCTDEDSLVGRLTSHFLGRRTSLELSNHSDCDKQANPEHHVVPLSHSEFKDPVPFRCISPDPIGSDAGDESLEVESVESLISSSNSKADVDVSGDEDIFDDIDEEITRHNDPSSVPLSWDRPSSPANMSTVSDLSESIANHRVVTPISCAQEDNETQSQASTARPVTPDSKQEVFQDRPDLFQSEQEEEEYFEDKWCENVVQSLSECGDADETKLRATTCSDLSKPEKPNMEDESFLQFFTEYIKAIVFRCNTTDTNSSEINWKDAILGIFMINDNDIENLLMTVENEVKKTPDLNREDAVEAPTLHVIESAWSFA